MKLNWLSIQSTLLATLSILLLIILIETLIGWLAFSRISMAQKVLLTESLPAVRLVNQAVEDSRKLIKVGNDLSSLRSKEDFESAIKTIEQVVKKMEVDIRDIAQEKDKFLADEIDADLNSMLVNVKRQIILKINLLEDDALFAKKLQSVHKIIQRLLVEIKLLSSKKVAFSDKTSSAISNIISSLVEFRSNAQQLIILTSGIQFLDKQHLIKKNRNEYRLIVQKMIRDLLNFEEPDRSILAIKISHLNDFISTHNTLYDLAIDNLRKKQASLALQLENQALSQSIADDYRQVAQLANADMDLKARQILDITEKSNRVLLLSIIFFISVVMGFALLFVKPRIVNRILQLNTNTLQIANGQYDIEIETHGHDEIATMAQSLSYFRDQLIEKNEVQQRLADREQALLTIINNTVEGLFTVDDNAIIRTFNPACVVLYGDSANNIIGSHIKTFLPEEETVFSAHRKRAASIEGDGYVVCREREVKAKNAKGQMLICSLSVTLLNMSGIQIYSCFLRDITDDKAAKSHIENLVDQLMRSNADLESFAYSCSHDLQEPVRTVQSFSELLERKHGDELSDEAKKYLTYIQASAKSARQLIKDMLSYSRLDRSDSDAKEWVSLGDICSQINETLVVVKDQYQGELKCLQGEKKLYIIFSQIVQMLTNLVVNGWKYNKSNTPHVEISLTETQSQWCLQVKDNGIGIDSRYKEKVFEVFQRLVSKREYDGSGIGLAICQKIAQKHGGRIWLESELGKGSCFFIDLPKPEDGADSI